MTFRTAVAYTYDGQWHHCGRLQFLPSGDEQWVSSSVGIGIFLRQAFDTVENRFEFDADTPVSPTPLSGIHLMGQARA